MALKSLRPLFPKSFITIMWFITEGCALEWRCGCLGQNFQVISGNKRWDGVVDSLWRQNMSNNL